MLLAGPGDGEDLAQGHAVGLHPGQQPVQGLGPHLWRGMLDPRIRVGQHTVLGPVLRQDRIEVERLLVDNLARVVVDHNGGETLGAGVQAKEKSCHGEGIIVKLDGELQVRLRFE